MTMTDSNFKLPENLDLQKEFVEISYEQWRQTVEKELKGVAFEKKLISKTYEGINLNPIYTSEDIANLFFADIAPGFEPFARGTTASGYLTKEWEIAQDIYSSDIAKANEILKKSLQTGQNSININTDTFFQNDLQKKLAINNFADLDKLFNEIDLEKYPINFNCGYTSLTFSLMLISWLKKNNINNANLKGALLADPIGFLLANGKLPLQLELILKAFNHSFELTKKYLPKFKTIHIDGTIYQNAGGNGVQELAFSFATAICYINLLIKDGFTIDEIAPEIRFTFGIGSNFFMEIAKFRSARIIWSNIISEYKGNDNSKKMNIFARTLDFNQTITDPYVNLLRTTTEAFSAVLGNVDGIETHPFNKVFGEVEEFSSRIAKNTQIILKNEVNLNKIIDPIGGSYFVENLTNSFLEKVWDLFQKVESNGGIIECIQNNFIQSAIEKIRNERMSDTAKRKSIIVGTNMYCNLKENISDYLTAEKSECKNPEFGSTDLNEKLIEAIGYYIINFDINCIEKMVEFFSPEDNLYSVKKMLRTAGEPFEVKKLTFYRASQSFEELRMRSEAIKIKTGYMPKVFLLTMGPLLQFKPRADFSKGFFETGGFDVIYPTGFSNLDDAVDSLIKSESKIAVLCSSDDTYPELVPQICKKIKERTNLIKIILAGYPKDFIEIFKSHGIDDFIFLGADVVKTLDNLLGKYE